MILARHCLLFALLIVCVYTDLAQGKIYNWCTLPALGAGLLLNYVIGGVLEGGWSGMSLAGSGIAVLIVLVFFGWPYLRGGLAAGDLKLMLAVGAIGGLHRYYVVYAAFYSVLVGALMAFLVFLWRGKLWEGLKGALRFTFSTGPVAREGEDNAEPERVKMTGLTVPYGVAISIGSIIAWYMVEIPVRG